MESGLSATAAVKGRDRRRRIPPCEGGVAVHDPLADPAGSPAGSPRRRKKGDRPRIVRSVTAARIVRFTPSILAPNPRGRNFPGFRGSNRAKGANWRPLAGVGKMAEGLSVSEPFRAITWTDVDGREAALIQRCAAPRRGTPALSWSKSTSEWCINCHSTSSVTTTKPSTCRRTSSSASSARFIAFRGQSALRTWIYRIVVNQARNRQRWWRRRYKNAQVSLDDHLRDHGDLP